MFVKFCGFTRPSDVEVACSLGVSACGFIFYAGSKRFCNYLQAKDCIAICKQYGVMSVGVFVDNVPHAILSIARILKLDAVQVYAEDVYQELSPHYTVFFALRVGKNFLHSNVPAIHTKDIYLFDTFDSSAYGGTGTQFNWNILTDFNKMNQTIIAGGLNKNTIPDLLRVLKPYGIDIASGIEDAPGIKSVVKMNDIIMTIKELGYDISR